MFCVVSGPERGKQESLKELGDLREVHRSTVAQIYLRPVLENCVLRVSTTVRTKVLALITTATRQGLMNPVTFIDALVCLQSDPEGSIRTRAIALLQEVAPRLSGFLAVSCESSLLLFFF